MLKIICLDIEAADNGEMLELSVVDFAGEETLYHSYYKPVRIKRWPLTEEKHHISPRMVSRAPVFKSERLRVQQIIDKADVIMGFAVGNDLKYLRDHGISISDSKRIVEVQQWFWWHHGRNQGLPIDKVPRLSRCCEELNFDFDEESEAHSAVNDTFMTIRIMKRLMEMSGTKELSEESLKCFDREYQTEFDKSLEARAHGYISLIPSEKGYTIRNNATKPESASQLMIEVRSRFIAEHDLRTKFKQREMAPDSVFYRLKESDIKYFLAYSNEYNKVSEEFYRSYYNPKKRKKRNLDFRLT